MSILNFWRREWRVRVSPRLAILGMVLLVLCALAVLQFRWIDRVAQAERERAKRDLTAAVSNFERDFDMEVTRLVTIFAFPAQDASEYAKRYKEWLRLAPYPNMIHGVYIFDAAAPGSPLRETVPGEPAIRSADWERDLPNLALPLQRTTASESPSVRSPRPGAEEVSAVVRAWSFPIPGVLVDGNPAFVFPMVPSTPGPVAPGSAQIAGEPGRLTATLRMTRRAGSLPAQWIVIVLDANYLQSTLVPNLLRTHLPIAASSGYDALVVDNTRSSPRRILYQSPSAPAEEQFAHADGVAGLFLLRPDCFATTLLANGMAIAKTRAFQLASRPDLPVAYTSNVGFVSFATEGRPLMSADRLAEILRRRPQSCTDAPVQISANSIAPWELLVRYRAGSLDQAMVTFRRRNLLWSVAVLSILVVGIAMLVLLTERARSLAQMQSEFVLGVSHELRTPLTVIRVAADNLKNGMVEGGEQARLYGDIIATQTSELSDMIEETLVFARVQSRALIRRRAPVNAEEMSTQSRNVLYFAM